MSRKCEQCGGMGCRFCHPGDYVRPTTDYRCTTCGRRLIVDEVKRRLCAPCQAAYPNGS